MDQRLLNAACSGDVSMLHQLLQENPFILSDYALLNSEENPLTLATKANQLAFICKILKLNPQLAVEVNQDGVCPLDVAAAYGHLEIVTEILAAVGPETCRQPGRDGRTALHYAVMNGRCEIIDQFLLASSDSAKDVTTSGETALHLAVICFKFGALGRMLQWLEQLDDRMKDMVNWGDKEGNTALHDAVSRKQLESVELLLDWNNRVGGNKLELNAVNKKGLTTTDIVDIILTESSNDIQLMRDMLKRAGGSASPYHLNDRPESVGNKQPANNQLLLPLVKPKNWLEVRRLFQFQWQRDSPAEARATLLVVATLIATVTFQAGITPPTYIFEGSKETINNGTNVNSNRSVGITIFLVTNALSFSAATSITDYLTDGLPFQRKLRLAMLSMYFAYGCSLGSLRPTGAVPEALLVVALFVPFLMRWIPHIMRALWKY